MEKIIVKEVKYTMIADGETEKEKYLSLDGKTYESEDMCKRADYSFVKTNKEKALKQSKVYNDLSDYPEKWYYAKTQEDLNTILALCRDDKIYKFGNINVGEWIGMVYRDGGDYPDNYDVYSMAYVKKEIKQYFKELKEIEYSIK